MKRNIVVMLCIMTLVITGCGSGKDSTMGSETLGLSSEISNAKEDELQKNEGESETEESKMDLPTVEETASETEEKNTEGETEEKDKSSEDEESEKKETESESEKEDKEDKKEDKKDKEDKKEDKEDKEDKKEDKKDEEDKKEDKKDEEDKEEYPDRYDANGDGVITEKEILAYEKYICGGIRTPEAVRVTLLAGPYKVTKYGDNTYSVIIKRDDKDIDVIDFMNAQLAKKGLVELEGITGSDVDEEYEVWHAHPEPMTVTVRYFTKHGSTGSASYRWADVAEEVLGYSLFEVIDACGQKINEEVGDEPIPWDGHDPKTCGCELKERTFTFKEIKKLLGF